MMKATCLRLALLPLLLSHLCATSIAAQPGIQPSDGSFRVYLSIIVTPAPSMAQDVVALVNQERAAAGCPPLSISAELTVAAQDHSEDMAVNNFFGHTGSNGSSPWDRIAAAGYSAGAAENVAVGYATADAAMQAWMGSAGHRNNILNCSLTEIGVGFYDQPSDEPNVRMSDGNTGGPFRYYWTQDFGTG
jgi:uncharacterized protein YkwD